MGLSVQDVVVDGDKTSLHAVASALLQLQAMYGAPSLIRGKGPGAAVVKDMLVRMQQELGSQAPVPGQHSLAFSPPCSTYVAINAADQYQPPAVD